MTVLRRIMDLPTPAAGSVVALGIDDFSFRRGRNFGTILVNLDKHQVIDLLADRSSKTAGDWMRSHPEIDYVSRDRSMSMHKEQLKELPKRLRSRTVFTS